MAAAVHEAEKEPGRIAERLQNGLLLGAFIAWIVLSLFVIIQIL
ncbi:MAG: hypothetical protein ABSC95_32015 [Acetobacteraceae bacterium]